MNEKGPDYQVDFGYLTSGMNAIFDYDVKGQIFDFVSYSKEINNNLYKYKYFVTTEEKIKDCEIFSPFSLFKCNGFTFQNKKSQKNLFKYIFSIIIQKLNIFLFMT